MKNLYTIGETSKIVGISTQMLRKYSNADLVKPQIVNTKTGYRYYSFEQFHIIDRIKYLRTLGISLKDIKEILHTGNLDLLMKHLKERKQVLVQEMNTLQNEIDDVQWYMEYFTYLNRMRMPNIPYIRHFEERYILVIDYGGNNAADESDMIEQVETQIIRLKNQKNYIYRRQWGYITDIKAYMDNLFLPKRYFIFLKERPQNWNDEYMYVIPAGLYLCLWCKTKEDIHAGLIKKFYQEQKTPSYALALEYENSLIEYKMCPYEYQSLIQID